ncbi:MAG: class I SAM-dependent methyltransferase, partial [Candidatus Phaeomarinobacter sp.]
MKRFAHHHRVSYFSPVTHANPQTPFDTSLIRQRRARAASGYGEFDFLKKLVAGEIAERLLDSNRSFEIGVDIGSHSGQLRAPLLATERLTHLIHADSVDPMVRQADGSRIVMDEEHLAIGDGKIDFATSALALHRLNALPGALIQIRRALRPDGLFIGAMLGGETLIELRTAFSEAESDVEGGISPRVAPFADVRDMGGLMQRAGFALPVVDADRHTVTYETPFSLLRDLRGMGETNALNARRKQPLRRVTLMRMAEIYAQRYATPEGRVSATIQIVYIAGWAHHERQPPPKHRDRAK